MPGHRDIPDFAGRDELLAVIDGRIERPHFRDRPLPGEIRGEHPLPLLCLLREDGPNDFLATLNAQLADQLAPQVPHAYVDAAAVPSQETAVGESATDRTPPVLPLLDELRRALGADRFGPDYTMRFDYYRLADWISGQELRDSQGRQDYQMVSLLRKWTGHNRRGDAPGAPAGISDMLAELPIGIARFALHMLIEAGSRLLLRRRGRHVLGLRREARWFLRRQSYLTPRNSASFVGFMERLTVTERLSENPEQVKKLLVHAFLEDLRSAYRRRRWRVFAHRSGWRRTAYTVVLLDNLTEENGGWELLRLISEVRNETGQHDPLLIVAAGDRRPLTGGDGADHPQAYPAKDAHRALAHWLRNLPSRRKLMVENARYLWMTLPPGDGNRDGNGEAAEQPGGALPLAKSGPEYPPSRRPRPRADRGYDPLADLPPTTGLRLVPRRSPWPARRGVGETVVALALVAMALPVTGTVLDSWSADCSYFRAGHTDGVSVRVAEVYPDDWQCIGYSDSTVQIFGSNERLRAAQRMVYEENDRAAELHRDQPDRPYISIVHFVGLTHREADANTDHASAEELEGMALRQREQNIRASDQPLLRVIVANGGDNMRKAPEVARDLLAPLFAADSSLLGVVGGDRTVAGTREAITELGLAGIPVMGTTLTGTDLADLSSLYFQLVPDNAQQIRLVADYARYREATSLTVYHPPLDPDDSYIDTLVAEAQRQAEGTTLAVRTVSWDRGASALQSLCADGTDRQREMIYYAGREGEFGDFLRSVTADCNARHLPRIVAADAASRFIAHPDRSANRALAGLPVSYVGMGSLVILAGESCVAEGVPSPDAGADRTPLNAFCAGYRQLHRELKETLPEAEAPSVPWPAERAGVAYDAAGVFVDATISLAAADSEGRAPHRAAIAQQLRERTFRGATGAIDFQRSRIGNNRNLAVLEVADVHDMTSTPVCVFLLGNLFDEDQPSDPHTGCPA